MLPDIRALLAAVVAAVGLLMISFGLVAMLRVAQESRSGSLQADLAERARVFIPASSEARAVSLPERPAPLEANPVLAVESRDAPDIADIAPVVAAAPQAEPPAIEPPLAEPPLAEPPMGGPLPEQAAAIHAEQPPRSAADEASQKAEKAEKAKKARARRIARQRKAAARRARAAQARAKQQAAGSLNNAPFGSFGNSGNAAFGR